jgi:hypothetical protein
LVEGLLCFAVRLGYWVSEMGSQLGSPQSN